MPLTRKSVVAVAPTDPKTFGLTLTQMAAIQAQSEKRSRPVSKWKSRLESARMFATMVLAAGMVLNGAGFGNVASGESLPGIVASPSAVPATVTSSLVVHTPVPGTPVATAVLGVTPVNGAVATTAPGLVSTTVPVPGMSVATGTMVPTPSVVLVLAVSHHAAL